jgi:hypothetical protein
VPQYSFQPPFVGSDPQAFIQARQDFQRRGPCSAVEIHVPDALASQLQKQGKPVPPPISGTALIDTGASISGIDDSYAQQLGLIPVSSAQVSTPSGTTTQNVYAVKLEFPGTGLPPVPFLMVLGNEVKNQGIDVLIGRDYLGDKVLIYNGPMMLYTICY